MSMEAEKLYRELVKFLQQQQFTSVEEAEQAAQNYIQEYMKNRKLPAAKRQPNAFDYLEKAQKAETDSAAARYAKKALELDPTLTEAELIIADYRIKEKEQLQRTVEALLKKEEGNLARKGITEANCAESGYQCYETRSYFRILARYIQVLIEQGKMRKAVEVCKKGLRLNEHANVGVCYTLMALYAHLEEQEEAEALYQRYPKENSYMLLPRIALYYKLDQEEKAVGLLMQLCERSKSVRAAFRLLRKKDVDAVSEIVAIPHCTPFSREELVLAYVENAFLYEAMSYSFLPWIEKHLPRKASSGAKGKKKN